MNDTHFFDSRKIKFFSGTVIHSMTKRRVDALAFNDPESGELKYSTDIDFFPLDKEQGSDLLENYSWKTANEQTLFVSDFDS